MRQYTQQISSNPEDVYLMTIEEFNKQVDQKSITNYDGCGYWVKDNLECINEEVFSSKSEDATHVAWYNK